MASHQIPSAVISLLFFLSSFVMQHTAASRDPDFYHLVLMWPGAYCKQSSAGCCLPETGQPQLDFFVRGLLPYAANGAALTQCKKSPFHFDELSDLKGDLYGYWPSIKCPSKFGRHIWRNTWETYGVCSGLSVHDYFKKALELRQKLGLLSILKKNGIVSTDNADYSLADVKKAIKNGIGATAGIRCSKNTWDESTIYEIYVCVDKDAATILPSCPGVLPTKTTCAPRVVFGSFTYDMLGNRTSAATANPLRMHVFDE